MLRDLSASWTEFHDCFLAWKISDSALNLRELEKYKEANKQLLVATDKSAGAAIIWHPELHKYEYKIAEYEKIFSHSLNTSETSSYPPQSMSSNKRRGLNVSGLSNVQLAHEIAVNDKLVFSASSDNLSILVRECSLDLAGGNFNSKSVNAIVEIFSSNAETLQIFSKIGLLSNTHPDTRDVRCIPSLAEKKGIPDNPSHNMRLLIPVLVKFTETLKALGCRHIDEGRIQEIENLGSIPPEEIIPSLERSLNAILQSSQSCKVDGLNCSLSTIRGKLIGELIRYEREEFEKSTSASSYPAVALPNASKFINDSIVALFPPSSPEPLSLRASLWQIFSHGLASLVFCPAPVEEALIPETFKLDTKRIYHLWTVAYSIAIASSLLSYASLKHKISQPSIHALGTQLIALLGLGEAEYLDPESDPYISVENIELCMSRIIASSPSYVQHSGLKGSLDRQSLRSDIQNITSHNSPVLKLVLSRLKNHCIKTLCHKSVLAPNPSDFILAKSLSEVTSHFLSAVLRLAKYNFDTYGPYYNMLLDYPTEQNQSKVAR